LSRRQGKHFSREKVEKIKQLLGQTEMSIGEIAERMGCSSGPILAINRRNEIRLYERKRSSWASSATERRQTVKKK
jgi:IS30 family transposase